MNKLSLVVTFLLIISLFSSAFAGENYTGKCVAISDGDTVRVMHNGKEERTRLYAIDCPEKKQSLGQKAKQFTSAFTFGKQVSVEVIDTDRYGRSVGIVTVDGRVLNEELLKAGFAWYYAQFCRIDVCKRYKALEEQARSARIGLWADSNPTPPWDWRKSKRQK